MTYYHNTPCSSKLEFPFLFHFFFLVSCLGWLSLVRSSLKLKLSAWNSKCLIKLFWWQILYFFNSSFQKSKFSCFFLFTLRIFGNLSLHFIFIFFCILVFLVETLQTPNLLRFLRLCHLCSIDLVKHPLMSLLNSKAQSHAICGLTKFIFWHL